ncbi:hypothetical protein LEMLEM_LOCUS18719, partial [Lemmus lemmus]
RRPGCSLLLLVLQGSVVLLWFVERKKFKAQRMKNALKHKMWDIQEEKEEDLKAQKVTSCTTPVFQSHVSNGYKTCT